MAVYPGALWRPIARYRPGGSVNRAMTPKRICLHTAVSNGSSLYNYFATPGVAVAHFYVNAQGTVEQYVDTAHQATANLNGNHDIISIETWDGARVLWDPNTSNVPPWNPAQVKELKLLLGWLCKTHKIPPVVLPDSKPGRTGVCWHRQGVDPYRVAGGETWSKAYGKICPGNKRVAQIPFLLKALQNPPKPTPAPVPKPPEGPTVTPAELETLLRKVIIEEVPDVVWRADVIPNESGNVANPTIQARSAFDRLLRRSLTTSADLKLLLDRVAALQPGDELERVVVTTGRPMATIDLVKLAAHVGFTDSELAPIVAIILAESNGVVKAVGGPNSNGSYDSGLAQINDVHQPTQAQRFDPVENLKLARKIYLDRASTFRAWATYNSGAYRTRLQEAEVAVTEYVTHRTG